MSTRPAPAVAPLRKALAAAQRAWRLLHLDAARALRLARAARSAAGADTEAAAWAQLALGFHHLYFAAPSAAQAELEAAQRAFALIADRPGQVLAGAGIARAMWRSGRVDEALALLLSLRDEGLHLLRHEQRGVVLNAIAGCYSAQGRSEEAFAHLYEALRGAGPRRGHGFDAVLYCNLSHELLQLGDYDEALVQIDRGLARCEGMRNGRLRSVLLINRVICLTELGRAAQALPDIAQVCALPTDDRGRGTSALHFATMAIAALRAGETALGATLLQRAQQSASTDATPPLPDARVELAIAQALLQQQRGDPAGALAALQLAAPAVQGDTGASLRLRCLHAQVASELLEALDDPAAALRAVRQWQTLHGARTLLASRARYQAAALQTELLTLQHQLEDNEAKRRSTEKARAELAEANQALSRKIAEVQSLQAALREQATQDVLTGLFNRRHLNDSLPALLALAQREREPLSAVVIDLDHFKAVNDGHGHAAGDSLLARFGRLLREHLRRSDMAFRYGGEEFCLLLPRTPASAVKTKLELVLADWQRQVFELDSGPLSGLGFSAGVADSLGAGDGPAALLRAADDQLLAAKRAGRRRVFMHAPADALELGPPPPL